MSDAVLKLVFALNQKPVEIEATVSQSKMTLTDIRSIKPTKAPTPKKDTSSKKKAK